MSVRWNPKAAKRMQDVEILIERIRPHVYLESDGPPSINWPAEIPIILLSEYLKFPEEVPDTRHKSLLEEAIRSAVQLNSFDPPTLISELKSSIAEILKVPPEAYTLITSISIRPEFLRANCGVFKPRQIGKSLISFHPRLPRTYRRESALELARMKGYAVDPPDYSYVSVQTSGRTEEDAVNTALGDIDVQRGIWNFAINYSKTPFSIARQEDPRNSILRGQISTLHAKRGGPELNGFWFEESYSTPFRPATDLKLDRERMLKGEKKIRRQLRYNHLRPVVERWLREYAEALDIRNYDLAFVSLWRLLERMCGLERDETLTKIAHRVSFLFEDSEFVRIALEMLRERRNEAVHHGTLMPNRHLAVAQLRQYVEYLLRFYIENHYRFRTPDDVATFLRLSPDLEQLKSEIRLRRQAMRLRSGDPKRKVVDPA